MNNRRRAYQQTTFAFLRALAFLCSPPGKHARLSILIYHRVLPQADPLFPAEVDAAAFTQQMSLLSENFTVLPLSEAVNRLRKGTLPARSACVTFDDGYADNYQIALPILRKLGIPATFFVATGFLDGGRMWNDAVIEAMRQAAGQMLDLTPLGLPAYPIGTVEQRRSAVMAVLAAFKYLSPDERASMVDRIVGLISARLPEEELMMRSEHVRALHSAGMEIGAHTVNHPILTRLTKEQARVEIGTGKERLEGIIRGRISLFAYPNGKPGQDYEAEHVEIVKSMGFDAAVSTFWGVATASSDPYQLPRFTPWDKTPAKFNLRIIQNMLRR